MYHPHHFLSQIKQMNQRTSVPANSSDRHGVMSLAMFLLAVDTCRGAVPYLLRYLRPL